MASADEYSAYVEQCIALAAKELHPGDWVRLLQMAKAWRDLAEKLEASQNNPAAKPLPVALKALVAHRGALGAGIVPDIVLRPPVSCRDPGKPRISKPVRESSGESRLI